MVDEDGTVAVLFGAVNGVFEIAARCELVGVPGKVYVKGRYSHAAWVGGHDLEEDGVFANQALHGFGPSWGVQPVDVVHFLNKRPLTDDGADEVKGKLGTVAPVSGHHAAESDLLVFVEGGFEAARVGFTHDFSVL
jgi:hypothetical protein